MEIYPVHLLDDAKSYRSSFLSYILVFNDVLDPQKLSDSLSELLRTEDWRRLGGRFRFNKAKRLEIHVPKRPSEDFPVINFSQSAIDKGIKNHALGSWLHDTESYCTVRTQADVARAFVGFPTTPQSMEDMMERDLPLLSLHVTTFADATVVALSRPHALMDGMGMKSLLRNWCLVLSGKTDEVASLIGNHDDPLRAILAQGTGEREELHLDKHRLGVWGLMVLVFRILCMKLWKPTFEARTVVLPQDAVDRLCSQARADIASKGDGTAFVSQADVFAGWATKMLAMSQSVPRPISVMSMVNFRFRLNALREAKGEYVNNMLQVVYAFFAPGDAAQQSLGATALGYRQQIAAQSTKGQMLSYVDMQCKNVTAKGDIQLAYGDPRAEMLTANNLSKLDFFHTIDFSAAVVRRGDFTTWGMSRQNSPGTIIFYFPLLLTKTFPISHLHVLGKDSCDRTLLVGMFKPETWERIRKDLGTL